MADTSSPVVVVRAGLDDLEAIVPLFDAYRQFYKERSDPRAAREFLADRLRKGESTVFVARRGRETVGFMQLYPTFSSNALRPLWILNDLFVVPSARRRGVAARLLDRAKQLATETGAESVVLETAVDNPAQRLYEACGWKLDREFLHYEWRPR
ncbi:MAG TPA: GNAT family N-acetyltransferase [Thermoplasmata archaeon]|nr:GNAT family N-acetyltransferase [Thermoplasmata archaeon]